MIYHRCLQSPLLFQLASSPQFDRPTYLMCPPQWYDIDYVINPWMAGICIVRRAIRHSLNGKTCTRSCSALPTSGCCMRVRIARHGLRRSCGPGSSWDRGALQLRPSAASVARSGHLRRWFQDAGFLIWETPRETRLKVRAMLSSTRGQTFMGRTRGPYCQQSHRHIADAWQRR